MSINESWPRESPPLSSVGCRESGVRFRQSYPPIPYSLFPRSSQAGLLAVSGKCRLGDEKIFCCQEMPPRPELLPRIYRLGRGHWPSAEGVRVVSAAGGRKLSAENRVGRDASQLFCQADF